MHITADQHDMLYEGSWIMGGFQKYLITIAAAAIIAAIINSIISSKGTCGAIIKTLTGIFVSVSVIAPLLKWETNDISFASNDFREEAQSIAAAGKASAFSAASEIISERTCAYILDKANSLGLDINVEVILDDGNPPQPCTVIIEGDVSPYSKEVLGQYIKDNLAIPKEDQRWS